MHFLIYLPCISIFCYFLCDVVCKNGEFVTGFKCLRVNLNSSNTVYISIDRFDVLLSSVILPPAYIILLLNVSIRSEFVSCKLEDKLKRHVPLSQHIQLILVLRYIHCVSKCILSVNTRNHYVCNQQITFCLQILYNTFV